MARRPTDNRKKAAAQQKKRRLSTTLPPPKRAPKRPPEIPLGQWRKLGPRQRRRYETFYKNHPGEPLYRARGKKAGESKIRAEKLEARLDAFDARQTYRYPAGDPGEHARAGIKSHGDRGEGWFGRIEKKLAGLHAEWVKNGRRTIGYHMDQIAESVEWIWDNKELYYH